MKKGKLSLLLLVSLLVVVTALMSFALVACNKNDQEPTPQAGAEAGVYYYDAGNSEYSVVLGADRRFTLAILDDTKIGTYSIDGETLTLTAEGQTQIGAVIKDDVIVLNYGEAEFRFLKKKNFTVKFESNAGSAVGDATVLNGKRVAKPADPQKDGFIFVGWYADDQFKTPFSFNSNIITANTTLFARWVEKQIGATEFEVNFAANNGGENPASQNTVGGKMFNLPVVERAGYTFKGWWVSMNDNEVLSYEFTEGMSVDSDVTLQALWQANDLGNAVAAPLVNVDANSVKWNSVAGADSYELKVQAPNGSYIVDKTLTATVEAINFAEYSAGDYTVTVVAVSKAGSGKENGVSTRVYKNKALARVALSQFSVIEPATLLFNGVSGAEKYLISVDCGDKNHNHINFDNGASTNFNFADCLMQNDGIKFTVTAVANGYASSVSKQFVYKPMLGAVTEFKLDEQTQKLVWNEVENATGYMVSVKCGNELHNEQFVNVGAVNSVSLKECAKCEGGIIVKVYPVSKFYISPEPATYTFDKQNLATPANIRINGTVVSWTAVNGAESYDVSIGGSTVSTDTNQIDLAGKVSLVEKQDYKLTVVAKAEGKISSAATDEIDARNLAMAETLKYENGKLSWPHVIGAAFYDVQVNDGEVFSVTNGENFTNIKFTKAGENQIKVRFVSETGAAYEWVSLKVFAHTVTFVSDGGFSVEEQYKAVGDKLTLPTPTKAGYNFLDWYNTPKGPETNGAAFKENVFNASGDIVLYACYTPNKYKINYHYGDGGNGVDPAGWAYYQRDFNFAVPTANDATSAFAGWFSAPDGNGVQYTDDKGNSLAPWNKTSGGDVYAFWLNDVLEFTLTKNGNSTIYAVLQGKRISQVSEVTIPATYKGVKVGMLSGNAFKDCSNLVAINIPNTVEVISAVDPFTGCSSLEAINVYDVKGATSPRYWSSDGVLFDNGSDSTQNRAVISFMPLAKTGSYRIPDGIVEIPTRAFANCALSSVVVPSSVVTIGMEAFIGSENLSTILFDTGSTAALTIADGAFANCVALESITLPARLTNIGFTKYELLRATGSPATQEVSLTTGVTNAFVGCKNLKNIYIARGNKNYKSIDGIIYTADGGTLLYCLSSVRGEFVVNDNGTTGYNGKVEIPDGVSTIADGAFIGCTSIKEVVIPNTVTKVGECAFYGTDIEKVTFKGNGFNDVTIGKYAFRDCGDLASVVFESGNRVTDIENGAFFGCGKLKKIELPVNLKSIGEQTFRDCEYLKEIVIASERELTIGADAFYNCESLVTLTLPKNLTKLPGAFSGCTSLREVIVHPDNQYFMSENGILYDKNKTIILFYPQSKEDTSLVLPDTLVTISDGVFRGNRYLESVTIGHKVATIGNDAFRQMSRLSEVIFATGDNGAAALEIGAYAFYGNEKIRSFELPARTKSIGEYAFAKSSMYDDCFTSFVLNEGLESIGEYAFALNGELKAVNIPASVKSIGNYAFRSCGGYYGVNFTLAFAANSNLKSISEGAFYEAGEESSFEVILPEGLENIGYQAFYGSGLSKVTIPNTVKVIEAQAFAASSSYYAKLTEVIFEGGGTDDLILGAFKEKYIDYNDREVYNEGAAFKYAKIESLVLPERVTFIGKESFDGCSNLTSVSFGTNTRLKHIGESAFDGTALESLTIPKSVSNGNVVIDEKGTSEFRIGIGNSAFYGIHTLTAINFEDGGTEPLSIGDSAFYYMNELVTINFPSRLADYTDGEGNTVRGMTEKVFASVYTGGVSSGQSSDSKLENINIAAGGLYYCSINGVVYTADKTKLVVCPAGKTEKVIVDSHVEVIESNAFAYSKISEIEFEGGAQDMVICEKAFMNANSLQEIVLPDNVVEIQESAFMRCNSLTKITLSARLKTFNPNIFTETNIQEIIISANNGDLAAQGGVVFSKDMKTLISYPVTLTAETYSVPAGVTKIADNAFRKNNSIKNVVLPNGLTEIGPMAFGDCKNLTQINIPNTVQIIKANAFSGCSALKNVTFEKNGTGQLVIETYAFQSTGIVNVELPATLISLGSYAFYRSSLLESVKFATGIKLDSIGDSAFAFCSSLKSIALPQGVSVMGDGVFADCTSLISATFAEGLVEIGEFTFTKCPSLETVSFPASLSKMGVGTFTDNSGYSPVFCTSLKSVTFATGSQLEVLPESTFYGCSALERFTVPANVTLIENRLSSLDYGFEAYHFGVFQDCTSLKSVTFEEGSKCATIGDGAFMGCTNLEVFAIPSSVSSLGMYAFNNCMSLVEMVLPTTVSVYGKNLFDGCSSLERVTLNEKATKLSDGMFSNCVSLKHLDIPASVTSFGSSLLSNTGIESFVVPSNIKELPAFFLSRCKSLTSVTLPDGLNIIGSSAFDGCTALTEIEIPDSVSTIADSAFSGCSALVNVAMPAELQTIGRYAFEKCSSLVSIKLPSKLNTIEYAAFDECAKLIEVYNFSTLKIELGSYDYGYVAYYAEVIHTVDEESVVTITADGFMLFTDGDEVRVLGYNGTATEISLPSNVTAIYPYAFAGSNIQKVTIPAGVTEISEYAFYQCASLNTVIISGQVTKIGESAFEECVELESITLPTSLTTLEYRAFAYCEKLKSIVIPNGVSSLRYTFSHCTSLQSVTLPTSLSSLNYAFDYCSAIKEYIMTAVGTNYKVIDGVLFNAAGTSLISVPAMKTGTFIVPKEVTSIDSKAFVNSHLDMLKFEGGRTQKLDASSYYNHWLYNAKTIKNIIISIETFNSINMWMFEYWTREQTIYFIESKEEVEPIWGGADYTKANVVYNYQEPQE